MMDSALDPYTTLQLDVELAIASGFGINHLMYNTTHDGSRSDRVAGIICHLFTGFDSILF